MGLHRVVEAAQRVGMTPAEAVALSCLLLASICLTAVVWLGGGSMRGWVSTAPSGPPVATETASDSPPGFDNVPDPAGSGTVVVDVAGLVIRPGLVELATGARVADAIRAAGGPAEDADTTTLNLARVLVDGEQILVGDGSRPAVTATESAGGAMLPGGLLSLNAATLADLQSLPGVGPVTAERILAHRDTIGGFTDVIQLLEVPGIGPARFADLEGRVGL